MNISTLMKLYIFVLMLLLTLEYSAYAHSLTNETDDMFVSVSVDEIVKTQHFHGESITISGSALTNHGIVIVIQGPLLKYRIWKKKEKYGIWIKTAAQDIGAFPSFLQIISSADIANFVSSDEREQLHLDINKLAYIKLSDEKKQEYIDNFYLMQIQNGLYASNSKGIEAVHKKIFKTKIFLPENIRVGEYKVTAYRFSNGKLVQSTSTQFFLSQGPLNREIYRTSTEKPLYYCSIAVLFALTAGSLAGYIFRNSR